MAIATSHLNSSVVTFPKKSVANAKTQLFSSRVVVAQFFKYWLPVILWMILIFSASTNLGASENTSRIIGPLLRWLNPEISDEAVGAIQFVIRKISHAVEYAILALLLWRARRNSASTEPRGWNQRHAQFAVLISAAYAATDEFHQYFVSTRQGSPLDVLLDISGAVGGMLSVWAIGRWLKRW